MEELVTSIKHGSGNPAILISLYKNKIRVREAREALLLKAGMVIEEGIPLPSESKGAKLASNAILSELDSNTKEIFKTTPYLTGIKELDTTTSKLWEHFRKPVELLLRKLIIGAPVIIRFHNDADGSSGAVALNRSIQGISEKMGLKPNIIWIMHRSVMYTATDAEWDTLVANNFSTIEKPLLLITDFGTSENSNRGIEALRDNFDIIWLDHHPIEENFSGITLENYINPWEFGSGSDYTAGYLTCAFAHAFHDPDTKDMEGASLIGDSSIHGSELSTGREEAAILDLLTSDPIIISKADGNIVPSEIESILSDKKKKSEFFNYAKVKLDEVLDRAFLQMKHLKAGSHEILVLDYSEIRSEDTKYPLPGRFASKLLTEADARGGKHYMAIVHYNQFISMRAAGDVSDAVNIPEIIKKMKEIYSSGIDSGGGHKNAASIKVSIYGDKKEILRSIIEEARGRLAAL